MAADIRPFINGKAYSHSSLEIDLAGETYFGISSISYEDSLEPGEGRGTTSQVIYRTAGEYTANAEIEMYLDQAETFRQALGPGMMSREFDIVITYGEDDMPLVTRTLVSCRITRRGNDSSEGKDPTKVKFPLHVMKILYEDDEPFDGAL